MLTGTERKVKKTRRGMPNRERRKDYTLRLPRGPTVRHGEGGEKEELAIGGGRELRGGGKKKKGRGKKRRVGKGGK